MKPSNRHPPQTPVESQEEQATAFSNSASDFAKSTVDKQLARLYGESVFGPWLDPTQTMAAGNQQRKRGSWGKRVAILLLAALVTVAGVWITRRGFSRQAEQDRAQVARDVAAFLAEGELERLSQFLSLLSPPVERLQATDPYLDLIVQAEAALYRYHDASPARLARIEPFLSDNGGAAKRVLARLTVASNAERLPAYETLKGLQSSLAKDPEFWTLIANMEEGRNIAGAHTSWERSSEVGPLWLPHRYQQCEFEARRRNGEAVTRMASHMVKVAPDSPWTQLALRLRDGSQASAVTAVKPFPPVAQYYEQLASVFNTGASLAARRQALGRALTAVNDSAPFVLDAFDRLMDAKAKDLATELTSFEAWPRGNPVAQAKLARLQTPASDPNADGKTEPASDKSANAGPKTTPTAAKVKKAGTGVKKKSEKAKKRGGRRHR
jgi:hypothetical protein